ncbi:sensor histidine kinase [Microbispora hainanensis]|uniref:histidine kinase n=1 Tax=Microbispora hainanensis TaxID=568844 RepID=A0A544YY90_9ACTN|nr:histidine kinase [Microbispora hainanensis]TQS21737.1 sensor histidine kinase [Microbispora hainanensis]
MVHTALRAVRRSWPASLSPGWRVERLIGTVMMVAALPTARPDAVTGAAWVSLGAGLACWLVFVRLELRSPVAALVALGVSSLTAAATTGPVDDGTAMIMACVGLAALSMHTRPSPLWIIAITCAAVVAGVASGALAQRSAGDVLGNAAIMLVVVLLGLSRRQYRLEAGHARRLLEQTRRAQAEHARAAALDERTRIARELHDVLAHSLGALGVQLELADALLSEKGDVAAGLDRVRRARRLAADGLAEARHAVAALREDVPPLTEALARLAAAHGDDHAGEVRFQVGGTPRSLPPAITVCLLRTTREALTNAARHAPATPVTVRLDYRPDAVRLEVRNGPGADGSGRAAGPGGYGLEGMRERLALVGGRLVASEVEGESTEEAGGWQVVAEVPA